MTTTLRVDFYDSEEAARPELQVGGRFHNIEVDDDITCLVGKNESGKTALLQALNKLNPIADADGQFAELDEEPDGTGCPFVPSPSIAVGDRIQSSAM